MNKTKRKKERKVINRARKQEKKKQGNMKSCHIQREVTIQTLTLVTPQHSDMENKTHRTTGGLSQQESAFFPPFIFSTLNLFLSC